MAAGIQNNLQQLENLDNQDNYMSNNVTFKQIAEAVAEVVLCTFVILALIGGLIALNVLFPHIMIPIEIGAVCVLAGFAALFSLAGH